MVELRMDWKPAPPGERRVSGREGCLSNCVTRNAFLRLGTWHLTLILATTLKRKPGVHERMMAKCRAQCSNEQKPKNAIVVAMLHCIWISISPVYNLDNLSYLCRMHAI